MPDTRKTQLVDLSPIERCRLAEALHTICRKVQDQTADNVKLPEDPSARIIAINMMHNVFDRLDEAVDEYLKERGDS